MADGSLSWIKLCILYVICIRVAVLTADEAWVSHAGMEASSLRSGTPGIRRRRQTIVNKLTAAEQQLILDVHNDYRRQEPASDMEQLKWNSELADMAQEWADLCKVRVHGNPPRNNPPFSWIGQNLCLFITTHRPDNVTKAVKLWYDEYLSYHYDTLTCDKDKVCGHYTQIVWAKTTDIGCGFADCGPDGQSLVCNYGPGGNIRGQPPYQLGYPCSKCQSGKMWCNRNLCNSQCTAPGPECDCAALCQNCATKDDTTCTCHCADGWFGSDCTTKCEDQDKYCGANPGYPPSWCTGQKNTIVYDKCLVMCNRCVPKTNPVTCPEVTPCGEWSSWDVSGCKICGGCGSKRRTRDCGTVGLSVDIDHCDPEYCIRTVHPKREWLWVVSKRTGKRKYIGRSRKCCYDFRKLWGTPHHLSRPKSCYAKTVQGWKDP